MLFRKIPPRNLILGTANFAVPYGLSSAEPLSEQESLDLLHAAYNLGINRVDSAELYPNSSRLVSNFQEFVFSIDTKISISKRTKSELKSSIDKHIEQFSGHTVKRILAHDWHRANTKEKRMFENLSSRYPYISFGVSIYDLSEFQEIRFCFQKLNVFQIPLNIINQTFLHLPNQKLSGNSIEFVVRSILLQGALDWNNPRNPFSNHPDIIKLSRFARTNGLSAIELTACFIQQSGYEEIVLGANSAKQLTELVKSFNYDYSELDFGPYASNDAQLKDPRCWNF